MFLIKSNLGIAISPFSSLKPFVTSHAEMAILMIIISKHTNQLCNRLFTYLPVISYALEADEKVMFLFQFKEYNNFFPNLSKAGYSSKWTDGNIRGSLLSKVFNEIVRFLNLFVHLVLMPGERIPLKKPLGVLFNPKWREIRYDHAHIEKHSDRLRWLFAPQDEVTRIVEQLIGRSADKYITVGVHIRRGDYKYYKDGRYYYSQEDYRSFMLQMKTLLGHGDTPIRFFVASNEKIETKDFNGLNVFTQNGTDMMVDLYGLAACDYIIGPPSTYSQWASFYGQKPLLMIYDKRTPLKLEDFKTIKTII